MTTYPVLTPAVTIAMDEPGLQEGEYRATRIFSASIEADGQPAGRVCATLVQRPNRAFYSACDAESAELQEVGTLLFAPNGRPRYPALKEDPAARQGGFMYISELFVREDFLEHHALAFAMATHDRLGEASSFQALVPDLLQRILSRVLDRTEMGAAAIRALLLHESLHDRWSVVAYICEGRKRGTDWRHGESRHVSEDRDEACEEGRRMVADARKFIRAGFKEVRGDGRNLYLTKGMLVQPPLSHAEALAVPLALEKEISNLERRPLIPESAKDVQLREFLMDYGGSISTHNARVEMQANEDRLEDMVKTLHTHEKNVKQAKGVIQILLAENPSDAVGLKLQTDISSLEQMLSQHSEEISRLRETISRTGEALVRGAVDPLDKQVQQGADLNRSCVLHCCAANRWRELFQPLVARGADVNHRDPRGITPLMLAASAAMGNTSGPTGPKPNPDPQPFTALLALGADKEATNKKGLTALGCFYAAVRECNDFSAMCGLPARHVDETIKRMLMPINGPTPADLEALEAFAEGDEEDEEFVMEDDDEGGDWEEDEEVFEEDEEW